MGKLINMEWDESRVQRSMQQSHTVVSSVTEVEVMLSFIQIQIMSGVYDVFSKDA